MLRHLGLFHGPGRLLDVDFHHHGLPVLDALVGGEEPHGNVDLDVELVLKLAGRLQLQLNLDIVDADSDHAVAGDLVGPETEQVELFQFLRDLLRDLVAEDLLQLLQIATTEQQQSRSDAALVLAYRLVSELERLVEVDDDDARLCDLLNVRHSQPLAGFVDGGIAACLGRAPKRTLILGQIDLVCDLRNLNCHLCLLSFLLIFVLFLIFVGVIVFFVLFGCPVFIKVAFWRG